MGVAAGSSKPSSSRESLPTRAGVSAIRQEREREREPTARSVTAARTSRVAEAVRENGAPSPSPSTSSTSLQVRQARGLLLPVRDREQHPASVRSDAPPVESRSLAVTDKDGEIFFVKHTMVEPTDARLALVHNRDSARAASYRLLRQRLIEQGDPKVILVTSARNREGKTTSATNLALAYAEQGRSRVLLVEANFRAASLGEVFGFKPPRCFSVQLERHRDRPLDPWVRSRRPTSTWWPCIPTAALRVRACWCLALVSAVTAVARCPTTRSGWIASPSRHRSSAFARPSITS
jgi:Mrp family chromosome partitioning ATPase